MFKENIIEIPSYVDQEIIGSIIVLTKEVFTLLITIYPINKAVKIACSYLMVTYDYDFTKVEKHVNSIKDNDLRIISAPLINISKNLSSIVRNTEELDEQNIELVYKFIINFCDICTMNLHKLMSCIDDFNNLEIKDKVYGQFLKFEFLKI